MDTQLILGSRVLATDTTAHIDGDRATISTTIGLSDVKALGRETATLIIGGTEYQAILLEAHTQDNSNELVREFALTFELPTVPEEDEKPKRKRKAKTEEVIEEDPCQDCEVPCEDCAPTED